MPGRVHEHRNPNHKHPFETNPPAQDKYSRGDDDWNLRTTACPIDSPKVNDQPGNAGVLGVERKVGFPVYDDLDGPNIFDSHTKGK